MNQQATPTRSGHLEVDGQKVWWEYHGDGGREAVCLLNGVAMHTKAWYGFLPLLTDSYDVILYDFLGQGQSSQDDIPYLIPEFARYLTLIMDEVGQDRVHLMGISYGGFVALDFARLYQERLHTLTLSGILLSHEKLFQMYQDLSLSFYRGTPEAFELYTSYMYEKIFGEDFAAAIPPEQMEAMRQRFFDRYIGSRHCLIRLTEAQDPFFAALDGNLPQYRAIAIPTLMVVGEQDRAIPHWQQRKIFELLPNTRWEEIQGCGHVAYMEKPKEFFGLIRAFMAVKAVDFERPTS